MLISLRFIWMNTFGSLFVCFFNAFIILLDFHCIFNWFLTFLIFSLGLPSNFFIYNWLFWNNQIIPWFLGLIRNNFLKFLECFCFLFSLFNTGFWLFTLSSSWALLFLLLPQFGNLNSNFTCSQIGVIILF